MDYRIYKMGLREKILLGMITAALSLLCSWLFYDSLWGMCLLPFLYWLGRKWYAKEKLEERTLELSKEFQIAMQTIVVAMRSGDSLETAFEEAEEEMRREYQGKGYLLPELRMINHKVSLHIPIEKAIFDFGQRSGDMDMESLGEIISFAKRSGGNLIQIMENTLIRMREKVETRQEIGLVVAGKKMEQRIMDLVPFFILLYLKLTSKDYLSVLYHSLFGVLFMTGCLGVYGLGLWISAKILSIETES